MPTPDPIWKGAVELGALLVPIALYPATAAEPGQRPTLKTLHRGCNAVLKQVKRCSECAEEVHGGYAETKALEYAKGKYALVRADELPRAEADAKGVVQVEDFVPRGQLDPLTFDRHYWAAPATGDKGAPPTSAAVRAFALLHRALAHTEQAAVVRVVLRTKQHLAALYPRGEHLLLTTLYYANEVNLSDLPPGADGIAVKELDFEGMLMLIDAHRNIWRHERYRDLIGDEWHTLLADRAEEAMRAELAPPARIHDQDRALDAELLRLVGKVG